MACGGGNRNENLVRAGNRTCIGVCSTTWSEGTGPGHGPGNGDRLLGVGCAGSPSYGVERGAGFYAGGDFGCGGRLCRGAHTDWGVHDHREKGGIRGTGAEGDPPGSWANAAAGFATASRVGDGEGGDFCERYCRGDGDWGNFARGDQFASERTQPGSAKFCQPGNIDPRSGAAGDGI